MAHRHLVDVHVALVRDDGRVLLIRRRDADPRFDGRWHLPAGKVEAGESLPAAAVREVAEEVGVVVRQEDLNFIHLTHAVAPGVEARVGVFFEVREWGGEPVVREPEKCSGVGWFAVDALPGELLEYAAIGLRALGERERAVREVRGEGREGGAGNGSGEMGSGEMGSAGSGGSRGSGVGGGVGVFSVYGWE